MSHNSNCEVCPFLFQKLNSCPTKPNFSENSFLGNVFELSMMFCSAFPYCLVALIVLLSIFNKTTRGFFLTFLLLFQNFICEMLIKNFYEDPRPEGSCGKGYGFPSSHASFCSSLFIWFLYLKNLNIFKLILC
jgi:membrane-associated phospholipid phosphatase